ncbi:MAG TPA: DNA adenine methylase [Pirellulales bacterium]|nr:DNA adenine methylase [Pirellulales bacterium]
MTNATLFDDIPADAPTTEGIKYAGSKLALLPYILQLARKVDARTVLDGFSGSTRVAQAFAKLGYRVIANDIAEWSRVFATCYLLNTQPGDYYRELIEHLNGVQPRDGWFTENYGGLANGGCSVQADGLKKPWQVDNTRKLDGIREEIENLGLADVEKATALTSLILALDEVDNTLGHFVSYLREWSPRSYKPLVLRVPRISAQKLGHEVCQSDVFDVAGTCDAELAYFDPPYGSNNEKMPPSRVRYASYYHVWTSICRFDKPVLVGKAKRRDDASDRVACSVFEDFRRGESGRFLVVEAIEKLIRCTRAPWVIMSYSSGGRATAAELHEVFRASGEIVEVLELDYKKNVMAGMKWTQEWLRDADEPNREFLFLIRRNA